MSYFTIMVLDEKKIPKNLPLYPLFLGEAPQLFVFVLVLSISRYGGEGGGSKCPDHFLFAIANFEPPSPQKKVNNEIYSLVLTVSWG